MRKVCLENLTPIKLPKAKEAEDVRWASFKFGMGEGTSNKNEFVR